MDKFNTDIAIFESSNGKIEVQIKQETVWLRQSQMAELFGRDRTVVTRHIGKIFKEGELNEKSNVQNMHIANSDRPVSDYSLVVGRNSLAFSGIVGYSAILVYCLWWKTLRYSTLRANQNFISFPRSGVGMQIVTLCVTERRAFLHEFPRRPWELAQSATTEVYSVVRNEGNWQVKHIVNM